jgi:hypothetical protein
MGDPAVKLDQAMAQITPRDHVVSRFLKMTDSLFACHHTLHSARKRTKNNTMQKSGNAMQKSGFPNKFGRAIWLP